VGLFDAEHRFYSFLDSHSVRLDFDKEARLVFVDVRQARRHWQTEADLKPPKAAKLADVRWLDFRETLPPVKITATPDRTTVRLKFSTRPVSQTVHVADNLVIRIDEDDQLTDMWITQIQDDLGGRFLAAFRKRCLLRAS